MAQQDGSVDKLLADLQKQKEDAPMRIWSMAEIDALLGDDLPQEDEATAEPQVAQAMSQVQTEQPITPVENLKNCTTSSAQEKITCDETVPEPLLEAEQEETQKQEADPTAEPISYMEAAAFFTEAKTEKVEEETAAPLEQTDKTRMFTPPTAQDLEKTQLVPPMGHGMEKDKNRERFLHRPQLNLEKTQEHREFLAQLPPQTIEKPAVIVKNAEDKTQVVDGLQAIPILLTPEDVLHSAQGENGDTSQATDQEADDVLENQIMLEGFSTQEEHVDIVDEEEAEKDLYVRRHKKAEAFKLFPGLSSEEQVEPMEDEAESVAEFGEEAEEETEESSEAFLAEQAEHLEERKRRRAKRKERQAQREKEDRPQVLREFYGPKDKVAVLEIYLSERRHAQIRMILSAIFMVATIVSEGFIQFTGRFDWVGGSAGVYAATHLVCLAVLAAMSIPAFRYAFQNLKKKRCTAELGLLVGLLAGTLQTALSFAYIEELTHLALYTPVVTFSFFLYYLYRTKKLKEDIENFLFVAKDTKHFYKVTKIEDEEKASEIGRGLLLESPDIRYSRRIQFPQNFVEVSKEKEPLQKVYQQSLPAVSIAGVVIGLIAGVLFRSVFMGVSAFSATVLAAMPVAALLGAFSVKHTVNKKLKAEQILLASPTAAEEALSANAVVVDAADLFNTAACHLSGMKLYHKMRVDEALLYTAAMVIQSGGTLAQVFNGVILNKQEILPKVDALGYEERLGCSGWIYNQRVLVGSRDLLQKHNVDVPPMEEERSFKKADSEILYLAVEGKVAALFVVTYASNAKTAAVLQRLENYGVNILVRTSDPNITESLVEESFQLPHNLVKIINPVAGDLFLNLKEETPKKEVCGMLHRGRPTQGLRALLGAFVTAEKLKLSEILLYIGCGVTITFLAVICFFSGLTQVSGLDLVLFQLLWTCIVTQIPKLKKL